MKTKKTSYLLLAAIATLSLSMTSCSQSEDVAENVNGKQTITFVGGDETTRTSMGGKYTDDKFPFYWEAGDAIWVNAADNIKGDNTTTAAKAMFTGNVSTSAPYKIRYTGTGVYNTTNSRTGTTVNTTSNANTLVIPPVQTMSEDQLGKTVHFGASGDCGTATATGSGSSYSFKLNHKAAYLILMPHWGELKTRSREYYPRLKSVTVTTHNNKYLLSGRFGFDDKGIGNPINETEGSCTIKVFFAGDRGYYLPQNKVDQAHSIIIAMKPIPDVTPLYFIYEFYDDDFKTTRYCEKIVTGKSFPANSVTPITAYMDYEIDDNLYSGFYQWDAPDDEEYFVSHEEKDDYNATPVTVGNIPTNAEGAKKDYPIHSNFKKLPTYNEISWYLAGGCYWDADYQWGKASNQKGGIWLKTKQNLISSKVVKDEDSFENTHSEIITVESSNKTLWHTGTPPDAYPDPLIPSYTKWFFIPATGVYSDGTLSNVGSYGDYWTITPSANHNYVWTLHFTSGFVGLSESPSNDGCCLLKIE